ncbi:helix-turn-helix domain-containing protein [Lactiplantibacillus modestisalitolerans]|uniref:Helix-turn-helix domain-containing protein n=1 Tax=Lactiplantibacillus modestisalitolerans TaxID=1457219 RepID=A0ABV5WX38_9LACO|nr:AraC family transcriptional regulator [Lactiplantibacillus modestisalitolerans]
MIDNLPIDGTISIPVFCKHVTSQRHNSPLHVHSHHIELYLLRSGDISFYTERQAFAVEPNTLILIPNGIWHCALTHGPTVYERVCLNIDTGLIAQFSTKQTDLYACFRTALKQEVSAQQLTEAQCQHFTELCDQLLTIIDHPKYAADVAERIQLMTILIFANQTPAHTLPRENQMPALLEKITHFIGDHLQTDLSLRALGEYFYLNPNYLDQYFKKYMNVSLHTYIIEKRIERAKQLLATGLSVTEVCAQCGYGNYSNFIRTFGKQVGVSPGRYKKQMRS